MKICVIYNKNKLKMYNISSSLSLRFSGIDLDKIPKDKHDVIITDECNFFNKPAVLAISDFNKDLSELKQKPILIQYESETIKSMILKRYQWLSSVESIVIQAIPNQKLEIKPETDQDYTIFFHGEDKPENMVDELFDLDTATHFEIVYYEKNVKFEPSKRHKLSWNVTNDKNLIGIIQYKIIQEIENGCLPILLKESLPKYLFAYPFYVTLEQLKDKTLLVSRMKEISAEISKMTKNDFLSLVNAMYRGVYENTHWKMQYYLISEKIREYT